MNKKMIAVFFIPVVLLVFTAKAFAHGVASRIETIDALCVTAVYDDGEAIAHAQVEIKAPDSDLPFQQGRTDRNGCFAFQPDGPGHWRIAVQDGLGHRVSLRRLVSPQNQSSRNSEKTVTDTSPQRPFAAVMGVMFIFGVSGWLYAWKTRKSLRKIGGPHKQGG